MSSDKKTEDRFDGHGRRLIWSKEHNDYVLVNLKKLIKDNEKIAKKNIEICYTCEKWNKYIRKCEECGCFMDVKKIVYKIIGKSPCPLGKW